MITLAVGLIALIVLIPLSLWLIPKVLEAREDARKLRALSRIQSQASRQRARKRPHIGRRGRHRNDPPC